MDQTIRKANSKVLLNPFDSPAAVKSSNRVATGVLDFRGRLGIDSGHESKDAKRWGQAAAEVRDKVLASTSDGLTTARTFGTQTFDRTTEAFRAVHIDGDGIPDRPRAAAAAEEAGTAIREAATGVARAFGTLFKRKKGGVASQTESNPGTATAETPDSPT